MLNLCAIQMQFLNAWSKIKFITSKRLEMGYRKHMFRVIQFYLTKINPYLLESHVSYRT